MHLLLRLFIRFHNQIQLLAYEGANLALFLHEGGRSAAALSAVWFALGSVFIFFFHPTRRETYLLYGGIALTGGGVFLFLAGFPLAAVAVVIASLETARGGVRFAKSSFSQRIAVLTGVRLYAALVGRAMSLHPALRVLNERPFLMSAVIKAPLRSEVAIRSLARGDWVTAMVGASWLLGDLAIALNDHALKQKLSSCARANTSL